MGHNLFDLFLLPGCFRCSPVFTTRESATQSPRTYSSLRFSKCLHGTNTWKSSQVLGFPGGSGVKESAYNAGDATGTTGLIPRSGRSPGEGNGTPLQYSCLGNPMDRGACWVTVHGVAESHMTEHLSIVYWIMRYKLCLSFNSYCQFFLQKNLKYDIW